MRVAKHWSGKSEELVRTREKGREGYPLAGRRREFGVAQGAKKVSQWALINGRGSGGKKTPRWCGSGGGDSSNGYGSGSEGETEDVTDQITESK